MSEKRLRAIEEHVRENTLLLREILRYLMQYNRVLGGVMTQAGDPMALLPIAPGNSPQFEVTPLPAGVTTLATSTA
jgi:Na+/H+ antiporter NhaB